VESIKVLLLGSGELGKEIAIELMRYNAFVIAADRYAHAPAMRVADESHVLNMNDAGQLRSLVEKVAPDIIVPEVEAIATDVLIELEEVMRTAGTELRIRIVPSARTVHLTMNREGIRNLVSKELHISTSEYAFAENEEKLLRAAENIGFPVVVKPIQSSSGKGQSIAKSSSDIKKSWEVAKLESGGSVRGSRVVVEEFVEFDSEITLLTTKAINGVFFCEPIGHIQEDGDYKVSWQPAAISFAALENAKAISERVVNALTTQTETGWGVFGVEFFIKGDVAIFSEVSPRPHDTGMVTMISQDVSEFAMHARAILGLPVTQPVLLWPSSSCAVVAEGFGEPVVRNLQGALTTPNSSVRVFGKPLVDGHRRVAVALSRASDVETAVERARQVESLLEVEVADPA
jgi:phosphoribosylglycinamide formyltransferase 2